MPSLIKVVLIFAKQYKNIKNKINAWFQRADSANNCHEIQIIVLYEKHSVTKFPKYFVTLIIFRKHIRESCQNSGCLRKKAGNCCCEALHIRCLREPWIRHSLQYRSSCLLMVQKLAALENFLIKLQAYSYYFRLQAYTFT